ncbi:protease HtpX, partial|nr:protease HtpX [Escherichia coli]
IQVVANTFGIFLSRVRTQLVSELIRGRRVSADGSIGNALLFSSVAEVLELALGILASVFRLCFCRRREFYADAGSATVSYTHLT